MNVPAYKNEISAKLPPGIPARYIAGGTPLFTAYGCALLERQTAKSYVYTVVNLRDGRTEVLGRRTLPLEKTMYPKVAVKIRASSVRGAGRYEVEAAPGKRVAHARILESINHVFTDILPRYGYAVRENQIGLAGHIFDALQRRGISLAESEVGTGKTHAYLTAAALAKRGRLNDFWLAGHYPGQSYAESAHMPIVIATSSIALQRAIVLGYIPELSRLLIQHDIIRTPLTCVIRKGKEHYLCEKRLHELYKDADERTMLALQPLLDKDSSCDLADAAGLTPYMKRKICVVGKCGVECPYAAHCRYTRYLAKANNPRVDFQVTNHNYFLADTLHRTDDRRPLLPHYQLVVIDEAHKFLQAARQMYGSELPAAEIPYLAQNICSFTNNGQEHGADIHRLVKKLEGQGRRLFGRLLENAPHPGDDEAERLPAIIDMEAHRYLKNICGIADDLTAAITNIYTAPRFKERKSQAMWELERLRTRAAALQKHAGLVCWLEQPDCADIDGTKICAIPKDLDARLYQDVWNKDFPMILTSGTLSASGDFSRVKHSLGIRHMDARRVTETSKPAPFDYRDNTLLYLSEATPFPDSNDKAYLKAVADETERLIRASHGHAAVLFTSYNVMGMVHAILKTRSLPYPVFRMGKGDAAALDRFKASGNGILFASGALWEGIDIPGDTLSLLIIVKLPFAAPDPIGDYEKTLYGGMEEYKRKALVPDMLVKLKQGFGRLIRTETDTGVCAILDSRIRKDAAYHRRVIAALPPCRVITSISGVERFMRDKKTPQYFTEEKICETA